PVDTRIHDRITTRLRCTRSITRIVTIIRVHIPRSARERGRRALDNLPGIPGLEANDRQQRAPPHSAGLFVFMDYSKLDGLIPAVVQDADSSEVLMVGFMNEEELAETRGTS